MTRTKVKAQRVEEPCYVDDSMEEIQVTKK